MQKLEKLSDLARMYKGNNSNISSQEDMQNKEQSLSQTYKEEKQSESEVNSNQNMLYKIFDKVCNLEEVYKSPIFF